MAQPPPEPVRESKITFLKTKVIHDGCDRPYLIRFSFFEFFGFSIKLHVALRSDDDRALHDHPWTFWTLMLAGGYWEESFGHVQRPGDWHSQTYVNGHAVQTRKRWCGPGSLRRCKSPHAHRLELNKDTGGRFIPAVTLVMMFPKTREWGFYTSNHGWTKWFLFHPNRSDCE